MDDEVRLSGRPGAADNGATEPIVRYEHRMHDAVMAFQPKAYPSRRLAWIRPRWDWMFLRSAERVTEPVGLWIYQDDIGIQAQRGAIMVRLQCGSVETVAGWLVDTVVLPHLRGRGVGDRLIARATRDLRVGLSLGQTAQIRSLQDRHGWRPVVSMRSWCVVLDAREAFRGRIRNNVVRALLARAGSAWRAACHVFVGRDGAKEVRRVERFSEVHDQLWERARPHFGCLVVRDASYLNWKYVEQPGSPVQRLSVVDGAGAVRGICVWTVHEADGLHAYARGWILDLIADPTRTDDLRDILDAVIDDARRQGVAVLEFDVYGRHVEAYLRRTGWIAGSKTRHLRVAAPDAPEAITSAVFDSRAWYLTRGDSDGDHPWWTQAGREGQAHST